MSLARKIYVIAAAVAGIIAFCVYCTIDSVDCGVMTFEQSLVSLGIAAVGIVICMIVMEICERADK